VKTGTRWIGAGAAIALWLAGVGAAQAQYSIGGNVASSSAWVENLPAPPGNGDGKGQLLVGEWNGTNSVAGGVPEASTTVVAFTNLPIAIDPRAFAFTNSFPNGIYQIVAWIDGNMNGAYDLGEPHVAVTLTIAGASPTPLNLNVADDSDNNGLPDWWEYHWFRSMLNPFGQTGGQDTDNDGLLNSEEAAICTTRLFDGINPANWDTDGDGMDDKWEYDNYSRVYATGLNPTNRNDGVQDYDGDGLSSWQEYCGVDGYSRLQSAGYVGGVYLARATPGDTGDDLNPLDIDSDYDLLIDSYEAAWYDVAGGIDPHAGVTSVIPNGTNVDTSIARADPDQDGLSNYREQCLLTNFCEGADNGDKWVWKDRVPFSYVSYQTDHGVNRRIVTMKSPLHLGLSAGNTIPLLVNRNALRNHGWTDPTESTSYTYTDEDIPAGHDSDDDWLPDGWEVQFGLDPRDDGFTDGTWTNGPFGDPDGDGIQNLDEYRGQDGNRFTTRPYVNGTGDETNPNTVDHRPDSCYEWRWHPTDVILFSLTNPRAGTGINRYETLGSSLPTKSLGKDLGTDTDDDGRSDAEEIQPTDGHPPSSPVHSCDPFHPYSALITSTAGIPIPDPEPALATNLVPAGVREDLQSRDWTLECQVKLLGTNLVGDLFNYQTKYGPSDRTSWRLSLVQNVPVLSAHINGFLKTVSVNALPTNRWVHLAGVWNHAANSLGLYIDGVLFTETQVSGESAAGMMLPATNAFALAVSAPGPNSFTNRLLLDEVRIWGVARTPVQIANFVHDLVPPRDGDDVWVDAPGSSPLYYGESDTVIVNGGSLFYGEPGTLLANVCNSGGNYWIDDGDGVYRAANDTLLAADTTLVEGLVGTAIGNVRWNDKDGDGVFSRNSLLAYYRFDDGGTTAEDFARPAKNSLIGATREDFTYGDRGYALSNGFQWVTNDAAPVYGVDARGADDSDHDGLPDGWELVSHFDPWDNGTHGESAPGAQDGVSGPLGDPDLDGLDNQYEFWANTNPRAADSDDNGVPDAQEDRDGDGVANATEQSLQSRPDMADTDDDGLTDGQEVAGGTSPANPSDPAVSRAVVFGGHPDDYLGVTPGLRDELAEWTLEAWVKPTNTTAAGAGTVIRRVVQNLSGGNQAVNYVMGLQTNGAGGLSLYGGFVTASGTALMPTTGPVPAGTWTHVAASYNRLTTTVSLYTNGVLAATASPSLQLTMPESGKGGESFMRIGEDFGGWLDEVRVWGRVRTAAQIAGSRTNVISGADANGLVHDFRFDDDQASTDLGEFHVPGGYQDYTFVDDWNTQWRHAARPHGITATTNAGAIMMPPSLRVLLQPPEAVTAGAGWLIDGGLWMNSGDNLQGVSPGDHLVEYKPVIGWTEPASETVTLTSGVATTITRLYLQDATISIGLQPAAAVTAGALWRVDAGAWLSGGAIVSNLTPGVHTVQFAPAVGYITPDTLTPILAPGQAFVSNVKYAVAKATLSAVITPADAVADGAQWRYAVGAPWTNSGAVVSNLPLGTYTVEFASLTRWITPDSITVDIEAPVAVTVTGVYNQVTGVSADIFPPAAITAGAQWQVGSGAYLGGGAVTQVPAGTYTVNFKPLTGWLSPAARSVVVITQQVTKVTGTYYKIDTVGNGLGTNPGQFVAPRWLAVDAWHRLFVSSDNGIQFYDPMNQSWTIRGTSGSQNGAAGTFYKPGGVAVDSAGNVYVADQNSSRLQVWKATNGTWQIVGGSGTGAGAFSGPTDVAVDSRLVLYVADYWNSRVQELNTNGVWSVIASNGTTTGHVQYPLGVFVDNQNAVYVSDDGWASNNLNRIQRFTAAGLYQDQLGDSTPTNGALFEPASVAVGATDLYVADLGHSRILSRSLTNAVWTTLLGSDVVSNAYGVAYDPRGILYVADTGNNRILALPVLPTSATSGVSAASASAMPAASGFVITWYGVTNWLYAIQYANGLAPLPDWRFLPGASNILGRNALTNRVDGTTTNVTKRFYRIQAY